MEANQFILVNGVEGNVFPTKVFFSGIGNDMGVEGYPYGSGYHFVPIKIEGMKIMVRIIKYWVKEVKYTHPRMNWRTDNFIMTRPAEEGSPEVREVVWELVNA